MEVALGPTAGVIAVAATGSLIYRTLGMILLDAVASSSRPALRQLARNPARPLAVALILGLGIGIATSVFSVIDATLLRPLPWPAGDRLVYIHATQPDLSNRPAARATWDRAPISWRAWDALRASPVFEDVGVWSEARRLLHQSDVEVVPVRFVSSSLLRLLGIVPARGRLFSENDDEDENHLVVLTHGAWVRRFGARPNVLGEPVLLRAGTSAGIPATIIGVLDENVRFPGEQPEFLLPIGLMRWNGQFDQNRFLRAVGRLSAGVTAEAVHETVEPLVRGASPATDRGARIESLLDAELLGSRPTIWLLAGVSGLLLLIACGNAAALLLAELRSRQIEIGVALTLGCPRWRLLLQLAVEHLFVGLAAGLVGLLLSLWFIQMLASLAPPGLSPLGAVGIDFRTFGCALGLGVATVMVCGVAPAIALSRMRPAMTLRAGSNSRVSGHALFRAILSLQLALTIVLLVAGSLLAESFFHLTSQPLGFDPRGVAVASIRVTREPWPALPIGTGSMGSGREALVSALFDSWRYTRDLLDALARLSGVISTAGVGTPPFLGNGVETTVRPIDRPTEVHAARVHVATEEYFDALQVPLIKGRRLQTADRGQRRMIVSTELERRIWGGNAVGRKLLVRDAVYEIVGVVPDVKQHSPAEEKYPAYYVLDETFLQIGHVVLRTTEEPQMILPLIREAIARYDPTIVITRTTTMDTVLQSETETERFRAGAVAAVGAAAVTLAVLGVYATARRWVAERHRELAVRMVCGAGPGDVAVLVLRETSLSFVRGCAVGLTFAVGAGHLIGALLFGVTPMSPRSLGLAVLLLGAAAACGALPSLLLAKRVDLKSSLN